MSTFSLKKVTVLALVGVALFYSLFAFYVRENAEGVSDHIKVLSFSAGYVICIFACLAVGEKLKGRSFGVRVAAIVGVFFGLIFAMGGMKRWLRHDAVWRELWDFPPVIVLILPMAQAMFAPSKENEEKPKGAS